MADLHADLIAEARKRWGSATAFRIGYLAGVNGHALSNTGITQRTRNSFQNGWVAGINERSCAAAEIGKAKVGD